MANISWQRQTKNKPAFPDILWNRPENKRYAGKLLVIGGHSQSFSEASRAYAAASKAGAGTVRVLLPNSLQKTLGKAFVEAEFAASTPIGSFSRQALGLFLDLAAWADGVLLAGDLGKNSETAILLDNFVGKYAGQLTLTGDSIDYFFQKPTHITQRENTLLAGGLSQLQKLAQPVAVIKQSSELLQNLEALKNWAQDISAGVITEQSNQVIVSTRGDISTTALDKALSPELAAYASVWWLQQPEKPFQALTTAAYCYTDS